MFGDFSAFLKTHDFNVWVLLIALGAAILYRDKLKAEVKFFRTQRKEWLTDKWKNWGEPFVIALILAIVIRTYILGPYKIPTGSMIPTFLIGDRIFVDKVTFRFREPKAGEIIVFKYPMDQKKDFVKRLVGLPGDRIEIREGKLYINGNVMDDPPFSNYYYYNREDWKYGKSGQTIEVPEGQFFVLGDNSDQSSDSRYWGFVPKKDLVGRAVIIWWPPNRIKLTY